MRAFLTVLCGLVLSTAAFAEDNGGNITAADKLTWLQAQARPAVLNALEFGGYNDWRLPTIMELQSLVRPGASPTVAAEMNTGCMPGCSACSCTQPEFHWSSTLVSQDPALAWSLFFGAGTSSTLDREGFALSVRAVRSLP